MENIDRIVRLNELVTIVGLSRSTIYRLIQENKFPKQIHLSERTMGWRLSIINEWIRQKRSDLVGNIRLR